MAHTATHIVDFAIDTAERARTLRQLIQKNSPVDTGKLKASWNDPRTVQILPNGVVEIDNPLPYARIQDTGGEIPPYKSPPGKVMRAVINGQVRYFTSRVGFHLSGSQYLSRALAQFAATPEGQAGPPLKVKFAGSSAVISIVELARETIAAAAAAKAAREAT